MIMLGSARDGEFDDIVPGRPRPNGKHGLTQSA